MDESQLDADIVGLEARLDALAADKVNIQVGISGGAGTLGELTGLAAVMQALDANAGRLADAIMGLSPPEHDADEAARSLGSGISATGDAAASAIDRLTALAGSATNAADAAKYAYAATALAGIGVEQAASQAHSAYGAFGLLTKEITLFGGALGDLHMIGQIPLWHILLDGILETTIGLTEATIALGVFAAAAAPAAEDIYTHIKSVDDVVHALGIDIPPVTGHFHDLAEAMAPQVVELYGGALNMMGQSGDALNKIVSNLVTGFDDWMAKLDEFSSKQSHTDGLVSAGADLLQQMSVVLDDLGVAFYNLMKADPGTVHFLADVLQGAAKLVEIFTEIPTPILYTTLALHSFLLWGGLLGTGVSKLLGPLASLSTALGGVGKEATAVSQLGNDAGGLDKLKATLSDIGTGFSTFGTNIKTAASDAEGLGKVSAVAGTAVGGLGSKLAAIATSPWTWAAVAAASLGTLAYEFTQTSAAAQTFLANWNSVISNDSASQAILDTGTEIGQIYRTQIPDAFKAASAGMKPFYTAFHQMTGDLTNSPLSNTWFKNLGNAIADAGKAAVDYIPDLVVSQQAENSVFAYTAAIVKLTGQQDQLFKAAGQLTAGQVKGIAATNNYAQALALMDLAGVKATDTYAQAEQKVQNLVAGYEAMSVQGGILSNSVDAITFSSEQQESKITDLTQAWTSFISMVTGGMSAFSTFETQMQGLDTAATTAGDTLSVSSGKAGILTKAAGSTSSALHGTTVALDGTSSASLQLQQTWVGAISDANQMMNALMMQASAAGLGAKGTQLLNQAGKDMVDQMLPMAKGSATATAQLYALAQEAGYHGPDAFQSLVSWVGKTGNAEENLQEITSKLTVASADLATDMENLAQAVGTTLNSAMSEAIFQASGGQKSFDAFATAVRASKLGVVDMSGPATQLAETLIETTGYTTQAHEEFDTFAIQLGMTRTAADQLWASVDQLAQAEANGGVSATQTLAGELKQIITNAGGASTNVGNLKTALLGNVDEIIASGATRQQLIKDLENAGLSAKTATTLVDDLETAISKLTSKTVTITTDMITTGRPPSRVSTRPRAASPRPRRPQAARSGAVRAGHGPTTSLRCCRTGNGSSRPPRSTSTGRSSSRT